MYTERRAKTWWNRTELAFSIVYDGLGGRAARAAEERSLPGNRVAWEVAGDVWVVSRRQRGAGQLQGARQQPCNISLRRRSHGNGQSIVASPEMRPSGHLQWLYSNIGHWAL